MALALYPLFCGTKRTSLRRPLFSLNEPYLVPLPCAREKVELVAIGKWRALCNAPPEYNSFEYKFPNYPGLEVELAAN